ncbi:MAG: class I SAM-dependent methyltransferase [Blastocatellia bacterium]|nr:class I SAM-dependent methyltransferase [Blastocatellia bacterium]
MIDTQQATEKDAKELAYLYDLYTVPLWRERFDRMVDEEIKLPEEGRLLDAGCGTGGYAVEMALRGGPRVEVVGIDDSAERLVLARGKAEVAKLTRVEFFQGTMYALGALDEDFDLVLGDCSLLPVEDLADAFDELARVAKPGAPVCVRLVTRGSFDEFFSLYWEALFELDLTAFSPQLEALIIERPTISDAETLARDAGLKKARSVTRKEEFVFDDAAAFFASPLIETSFLDDWMAILPDAATRAQVRRKLVAIIDRERHGGVFDLSIKATLVIAQKC